MIIEDTGRDDLSYMTLNRANMHSLLKLSHMQKGRLHAAFADRLSPAPQPMTSRPFQDFQGCPMA